MIFNDFKGTTAKTSLRYTEGSYNLLFSIGLISDVILPMC
jgi:hypothetical protein